MTDETRDLLKSVNRDFSQIQTDLLNTLGNEGADIGDAGTPADLLGNMWFVRHDSYSTRDVDSYLSGRLQVPKARLRRVRKELRSWTHAQWKAAQDIYDGCEP